MPKWQPITCEIKAVWGWDGPDVLLRDAEGTREAVGSWGFEDENYDGDYWFAWHKEDGVTPLGFEPVDFAELEVGEKS